MKQGLLKFAEKHLPVVLTVIGSAGVIATAVIAAKAAPKAEKLLENAEKEKQEELTFAEKVRIAAPEYVPAAITGVCTVMCIVGSEILNKRAQASLSAAYALMADMYSKYRRKAVDIYGEDADKEIKKAIAVEQSKDVDIYVPGIFCGGSSLSFDNVEEEERLFYDSFSGRYFQSTIGKVLQAEYHLNRNFVLGILWVTVNDFYDFLGLEHIEGGDDLGWYGKDYCDSEILWIDFDHSAAKVSEEGPECCIIDMVSQPMPQ